jgi:coproporphyrinogen III oxidase-like Fe-S oxidoreductase
VTFKGPVTGADTEIDRRRGDREDIDQCVTVIRDVDVDLDVVDQITGLTEQGVAEIRDLLEQICTVGTTNLDVFDGQ